jgi:formate dehydrogenase iron-sulfur subunit
MSLNRRQFIKLAGLGLGGLVLSPQGGRPSGEVNAENDVAMLYDTTKCVGCRACQIACKDWNNNPPNQDPTGLYDAPMELSATTWTLITLYESDGETSFARYGCMHCLEPACVSACPVHALQKTADGPVTYDPKRCIGCRYCMVACPFHVPRFQWNEVLPKIAKCTFCTGDGRDRLAMGLGPACADRCPTQALIWGTRGELLAEAERRLADNPDTYVNHIYGKDDAGGTSVLYLSHVPFDRLGLPDLGPEPVPELNNRLAPIILPSVFFGGAAVLAGAYYLTSKGGEVS